MYLHIAVSVALASGPVVETQQTTATDRFWPTQSELTETLSTTTDHTEATETSVGFGPEFRSSGLFLCNCR